MKTEILVLGDSWAAAREADTGRDAGWPEIMGVPETHRQGVSGSTAAEWAGNNAGWLTRATQTSAEVLIVSLLGNDAMAALGDGVVTAGEIEAGLGHLRAVVQAVQRSLTVVLLYADPFFGRDDRSRVGMPMLNGAIRMACAGLPVVFADTGAWLSPSDFDGRDIHPTRAGHRVIAERMAVLMALGNETAVEMSV